MLEIDIPVAGGDLRVLSRPGDGPVAPAVHGLTANALSWAPVARADVNHHTIPQAPRVAERIVTLLS